MRASTFNLVSAGLLASTALASPALAQTAPPPPPFLTVDDNGVDLVNGGLTFAMTEGSIGPADDPVTMDRYWTQAGWTDNWTGALARLSSNTEIQIAFGQTSDKFVLTAGTWVSSKGDGATLTVNAGGDVFTYTASDGTVITYTKEYDAITSNMQTFGRNICQSTASKHCFLPTQIVRPNGRTTTLQWEVSIRCIDAECFSAAMVFRLPMCRIAADIVSQSSTPPPSPECRVTVRPTIERASSSPILGSRHPTPPPSPMPIPQTAFRRSPIPVAAPGASPPARADSSAFVDPVRPATT